MPVAIILAGGRGSRLKSVTSCIPKPMVEIDGKPFLAYLLNYLGAQGINEIVLSVGYRSEVITEHFQNKYGGIQIKYAIEDQPLGTGGAIRNALRFVRNKHVFIMNGDTFYPIKLATMLDFHNDKSSCITLALKYMRNAERYGTVSIDGEGKVISIEEKRYKEPGLINGGIYLIFREIFNDISLPDEFSFELDFLGKHFHKKATYGLQFDDYFIDIGVPNDYERAKTELKRIGH
ncbi:MAG: nucleotidyltransferase family protein [Candidatus Atribacteria bacterium]|nr:nucleotidyltransferase family protein [Candidatus Atribacteria bacterium]